MSELEELKKRVDILEGEVKKKQKIVESVVPLLKEITEYNAKSKERYSENIQL